MIKLLGGARIVNLSFLSEIISANTHPTRSAIALTEESYSSYLNGEV